MRNLLIENDEDKDEWKTKAKKTFHILLVFTDKTIGQLQLTRIKVDNSGQKIILIMVLKCDFRIT